jgi:hypothetical protein
MLREFPPLRAAWARRGEQARVQLSGRNARCVVHGALNVATGELVHLIRECSRQDDCLAFVTALGHVRPDVPKLLVWDNAPPHHPKTVLAAAEAAHIAIAFLPFRAPELMPCEDLLESGRLAKGVVAANRVYESYESYESVHEPFVRRERAVAWLDALSPYERLLKTGLFGLKFQWLFT